MCDTSPVHRKILTLHLNFMETERTKPTKYMTLFQGCNVVIFHSIQIIYTHQALNYKVGLILSKRWWV